MRVARIAAREAVFPARAGVIPTSAPALIGREGFPRTRGGDPKTNEFSQWDFWFSPHARG